MANRGGAPEGARVGVGIAVLAASFAWALVGCGPTAEEPGTTQQALTSSSNTECGPANCGGCCLDGQCIDAFKSCGGYACGDCASRYHVCTDDSACAAGEKCQDGFCGAPLWTSCKDVVCAEGLVCLTILDHGDGPQCEKKCTSDAECPAGHQCVDLYFADHSRWCR